MNDLTYKILLMVTGTIAIMGNMVLYITGTGTFEQHFLLIVPFVVLKWWGDGYRLSDKDKKEIESKPNYLIKRVEYYNNWRYVICKKNKHGVYERLITSTKYLNNNIKTLEDAKRKLKEIEFNPYVSEEHYLELSDLRENKQNEKKD